ncbi:hypothetical protein [Sphingobium nicotianae]|uniref:Uncharacterized protein n=1 Tax=Sphingobium nicotianae TaxID=2782607 RepID=A0A9X1D9L4_9SPHN|nr:hypothetical protein [Sphingobium nicotianae]MBT2185570.1 hypothetical protein [Sphingobium nicotianae]
MRSETIACTMKPGRNEVSWWAEIKQAADAWHCSVISLRGDMWPSSKGRTIVYKAAGEDHMVTAFMIARPS